MGLQTNAIHTNINLMKPTEWRTYALVHFIFPDPRNILPAHSF